MADITITSVEDFGADVLLVKATDADGKPLEARGWVSATQNHYDASAYSTDDDGQLVRDPKAKPRAMTAAEVGEYARTLIAEANAAPAPVAFA